MTSGGFMDKMLDRVPGYAGYRDKERRRDSDRALRERLALEYSQQAARLQAIQTRLADERKIMLLGALERPLQNLQRLIDRLRAATYGYAPLFSDNQVDERALDQLAAFDRSLADQQDQLAAQITQLEAVEAGTAAFKALAAQINTTVDGLQLRVDKRGEVIQNAKPATEPNVLALLEKPAPAGGPLAYRLRQRDAVSREGADYTVTGRISVETPQGSWRLFQLAGGDGSQWLEAPATDGAYRWLRRTDAEGRPGAPSVSAAGAAYNLAGSETGTAEVAGVGGQTTRRVLLTRHRYGATAGNQELHLYAFEGEALALLGNMIDARELDLFTREQ